MAQERRLTHPSDNQLQSFWAGSLSPEELERMAAHVDGCGECERRLEAVEPAFSQYRRCLDLVHSRMPRPARTEADLRKKMREIEARRAPRRRVAWRRAWVSGMAAALAGLAILVVPHLGESELRADTLLQQAVNAPSPANANRRLRIRTHRASFARAAVVSSIAQETGEEAALRERFAEAHYDWADPLSARSFSLWRHGLKHKASKVSGIRGAAGQPERTIETDTDEGALREAELTLDAKLLPVSAWFRFADREWVEIAAEPAASPEPAPALSALPAPPAPLGMTLSAPAAPLAERELTVRLAIDALQPGAAEPVEVSADPDGSIRVTTYRLAPELESRLRASLDRIPGVTVRSATGEDREQVSAPRGAEPMDRAIRASQDVSFEAHMLAELADRFQPAAEAQLTASGRAQLWELRMKHVSEMNRGLASLRRELERQRREFRPGPAGASDGPQTQSMADTATAVDRLVTVLYTGAGEEAEQAEAWRQLAAELGNLQSLAASYGRYVEQHRKELP